jgi:prepilin-type N-terminal cleavage/methylation domain-containing protein
MARAQGFTLIEVALAIGIVAFAMVASVALLPVGMNSMTHARDESAASAAISQISQALWTPVATGSAGTSAYAASGVWQTQLPSWSGSGAGTSKALYTGTLSLGGIPSSTTLDNRLLAAVQITDPVLNSTNITPGVAKMSVAWPVSPGATYNSTTNQWSGVEGSLSSIVYILPPNQQ